jgi:pilus assembly protein CpaF
MSQAASTLATLLTKDEVSEVHVLGRSLAVKVGGVLREHPQRLDDERGVLTFLDDLLRRSEQPPLDPHQPVREFVLELPPQGRRARFHLVLPPLAKELTLTVAKQNIDRPTLTALVANGTLTGDAADFLRLAVRGGASVLVAGTGGAGKTTLVTALVHELERPEHLVTIEEVPELAITRPHVSSLYNRGLPTPNSEVSESTLIAKLVEFGTEVAREGNTHPNYSLADILAWLGAHPPAPLPRFTEPITLARLVREAMRMRADRIALGEVRGDEAFDLLIAGNSGTPIIATIHALAARDALAKLAALATLRSSREQAAALAATAIDVVVFLRAPGLGRHAVDQIIEVDAHVVDRTTFVTQELYERDEHGALVRCGAVGRALREKLAMGG